MALAVADFWKLAIESKLLTAQQCQQFAEEFGRVKGAAQGATAGTLAEWLISQNIISRYQATILLAGKSGPFEYGDYRVYDRVEGGRLTGAFRAVHAATGHPVMLSFLSTAVTGDAARWRNTVRAAQTLGALNNSHLRRCYDLVDLGKYRFLVQEDLRGATLRESLAPGQVVRAAEACRAVRQAALGMASLHAVATAHGSATPDQLWLTDAGQIKVLFDPSRRGGPIDFAVDQGGELGTLIDYLAPELFRSGQSPNPATDVYALGCVAYELLAGRPPFPGGSLGEKASRHASEPIAPLEYAGVPQPVAHVVSYMLAKDPAVRIASAAVLVDALAPLVDPAAAAFSPPAMPTAAAFERWVVEHQAIRARRASQNAAAAESTPTMPAGPAISIDLGGPKTATSATGGVTSAVGSSPAYRRRSKSTGMIAAGIAAAAALVIGIVVVNAMNGSSSDGTPDAVASPTNVGEKKGTSPDARNPKQPNGTAATTVQDATARDNDANEKPPVTPGDDVTHGESDRPKPPQDEPRERVIDDDGKLLWASPTWGPPIDARLVGLGAQAMLVVRPAALMATAHGEQFLAAMGPAGATLRSAVEGAAGAPFESIERAGIVLYANGDQPPKVSYIIHFRDPVAEADAAKRWKDASQSRFEGKKLYASETTAYYLPAWGENRALAVGAIDVVQEIIRQDDKPGSFGPLTDKLLARTDADRHITFIGSPQYLFGDGRKLFAGPAERLREPLDAFVGDGVRAVAVSLHLDDVNFFAELRALGTLENKPDELAARFAERLTKLPRRIEDAQVGARYSAYGEKTLRRFPQMLTEAAFNLRMGVDDGQAVLRCYLPAQAGANLAQAVDLAVHESGGGVAVTATPVADTKPKTAAEKLSAKITLSFPRESLERALELWSNEVGVKVVMLGTDMMAEGITKNQSINDFNEQDVGAEAVLLKILKIANAEGKLVYILKPESSGSEVIVQITTRTAVKSRGDALPPSLKEAPAEAGKKR
ncbi:MAG: serine/threonine-protein kinase [Pirellulales bacterium]